MITNVTILHLLIIVAICAFVRGDDIKSNVPDNIPRITMKTEHTIIERATMWLLKQKNNDDSSWGNNTHTVLLALRLANLSHYNYNSSMKSIELKLSEKQMELEIVLMLWRHRDIGFSIMRLAKYTLALNSMCMDPRQFHGHDLIGMLQHHESSSDHDFALISLAVCSAEAHVRKRQIRRLIDIANSPQYHSVDTLAMVIMALRCVIQDHRHRNLYHFVKKSSMGLAERQRLDGSFGDIHSTGLVMQALEDVENESSEHWNRSAAIVWLLSQQQSDGSFDNSIEKTAEIILGIIPKSIVSIRMLDCNQDNQEIIADTPLYLETNHGINWTENYGNNKSINYLNPSSTLTNEETNFTTSTGLILSNTPITTIKTQQEMVNISYTIWIGNNETFHLIVTAPKNGTFYRVMLLAAEISQHFEFSASEWPNGHYVHTLAGLKEEPMSYHYWLLYKLSSPPDKLSPPGNQLVAPGGIDDLEVSDGEYYLFWYKKL